MQQQGRYIFIVPLGPIDAGLLEQIKNAVGLAFSATVGIVKPTIDLSGIINKAFEPRRKQYYSSVILEHLCELIPKNNMISDQTYKILGLTEIDLATPVLTFVFGEAQLNGACAIISLARLRQEFYELPPNQKVLHKRVVKEAVHELGHTFGLLHCDKTECVMHFSSEITDIDQKDLNFCPHCLGYLQKAISMYNNET